ncbi:uncharacterized protein ANIA_11453 [Aspergillus nidulans FGSC A4]|uniref:Uncharacterized protein n=1 Tax=Emericella nidulans (strain FGSC A4 / ATCC 38163 / CBS 112.46 / NRRL 194 / M139) TaxID=227321 RepID=C8V927_EMENI|nr:hypothetical protein [Aspergillus nidulans FGSC A4]CBF76421.1 TPA: hypothetical protein ANIA_11453 [Aspergillus nidulans FGSC A4]
MSEHRVVFMPKDIIHTGHIAIEMMCKRESRSNRGMAERHKDENK